MTRLDRYAIVHRIAENLRRAEYDMLCKQGSNTLDAMCFSWRIYSDFMDMAIDADLI